MGEIQVRFLVNTASKKILYMEAGKGFVDLLLGFLQLLVATILNIFNREAEPTSAKMEVGSITNIYKSLQRMSDSCLLVPKDGLLKPPSSLQLSRESPQLLLPLSTEHRSKVFRCSTNYNHLSHVSMASGVDCRQCTASGYRGSMTYAMVIEDAAAGALARSEEVEGYVHPHLSFIVTDELRILPASTIESIVLLNKLKIEKLSDLDSFETVISPDEALELLKVLFTTRTALNQIFSAKIPNKVGVEAYEDRVAAGLEKLASVPTFGGGGALVSAAVGGASVAAAAEEKKDEQEEKKELEKESDEDMGFSLFD